MNKRIPYLLHLIVLLLAISLLITILNMLGIPNPFFNPFSRPAAVPRPVTPPPGELGGEEQATIEVFEKVSPSVVFITKSAYVRDRFSWNIFEIPEGTGSGFIWDHEGHIVTNFHVVYKASSISVMLQNQSTWNATLVGQDPHNDLAVVRIGASKSQLQPVMIGSSSDLKVGQKVLAIGNPFGLDSTLTVGIISALGRTIQSLSDHTIYDVIQTDAAINPGNSGGPLLDSFGRMIGVNTAIISRSGSSAGIGFAVPVDTVNRIVPQLISRGDAPRPFLGVLLLRKDRIRGQKPDGAVIRQVYPGEAAAQAGLEGIQVTEDGKIQYGDIIVGVDGESVSDNEDLQRLLDKHSPGDTVQLDVRRDGNKRTVTVQLGSQ